MLKNIYFTEYLIGTTETKRKQGQPALHSPTEATAMEPDHVDKLLERYLLLLDEYTQLRSTLESIQSAMYQNIARANFSGERGVRYGRDFYDERMQASRRVEVSVGEEGGVPEFSVVSEKADVEGHEKCEKGEETKEGEQDREGEGGQGGEKQEAAEESESGEDTPQSGEGSDEESDAKSVSDEEEVKEDPAERKRRIERHRNPLRWFGFVTPLPLRYAQDQAIQLVETVIPRLASVDAEMKEVEIEIRRARKRRAKAEAESAKANAQDEAGAPPVGVEAT